MYEDKVAQSVLKTALTRRGLCTSALENLRMNPRSHTFESLVGLLDAANEKQTKASYADTAAHIAHNVVPPQTCQLCDKVGHSARECKINSARSFTTKRPSPRKKELSMTAGHGWRTDLGVPGRKGMADSVVSNTTCARKVTTLNHNNHNRCHNSKYRLLCCRRHSLPTWSLQPSQRLLKLSLQQSLPRRPISLLRKRAQFASLKTTQVNSRLPAARTPSSIRGSSSPLSLLCLLTTPLVLYLTMTQTTPMSESQTKLTLLAARTGWTAETGTYCRPVAPWLRVPHVHQRKILTR